MLNNPQSLHKGNSTRGQALGRVGNTGYVIAGPGGDGSHLHFEVRAEGSDKNNKFKRPEDCVNPKMFY